LFFSFKLNITLPLDRHLWASKFGRQTHADDAIGRDLCTVPINGEPIFGPTLRKEILLPVPRPRRSQKAWKETPQTPSTLFATSFRPTILMTFKIHHRRSHRPHHVQVAKS
jgi:hypothetical protein